MSVDVYSTPSLQLAPTSHKRTAVRRDCALSLLLRIAAVLLLSWAVILLPLRACFMPESNIASIGSYLANGWAGASLAMAIVLLQAAREPHRHRAVIVAAIVLMACKTANDLYGLLVLPPMHTLAVLVDLVLSVGVLVGILRELPRTLDAARTSAGGASGREVE
jgi:hypothetical protein